MKDNAELIKENEALKIENAELSELIKEAYAVIKKVSNEQKTFNDISASTKDLFAQLGLGSDAQRFTNFIKHLNISDDAADKSIVEQLLEPSILLVELKTFTEFYNQHAKTKLNPAIVDLYKDFKLNHQNELSSEQFHTFFQRNALKKSPLKWIASDEELFELFAKMKEIINVSATSFQRHFEGFHQCVPPLVFNTWGSLDLIYFFQELEDKKKIRHGFMKKYAHHIYLHTGILSRNLKKSKNQSGALKEFYSIDGHFIRAISSCPMKQSIDNMLSNL